MNRMRADILQSMNELLQGKSPDSKPLILSIPDGPLAFPQRAPLAAPRRARRGRGPERGQAPRQGMLTSLPVCQLM